MMISNKKIAFLKWGNFSHVNDFVYILLTKEFPDYEVEVINVWPDLVNELSLVNIIPDGLKRTER